MKACKAAPRARLTSSASSALLPPIAVPPLLVPAPQHARAGAVIHVQRGDKIAGRLPQGAGAYSPA